MQLIDLIDPQGHLHKAGHLCNRCSAGSRPALVIPLLLIAEAEQLSALHLSRLMWVASWHDMVPGSKFIEKMYEKKLPPYLKHHLLFSYKGDCHLFLENNDGTVELSSELDYRAQSEAEEIYGFNEDHGSIVFSKPYLSKIEELLGR